ncbi:MAG: NAD(P)/FAD-dependent oxidoreductase [Chitinophagaceae bacterium]|nr:NAD(P)/FAD-dependent oxidoreductase [Chitinophagaceae bacterium]
MKQGEENQSDVICIGGGLGSLVAAALLAKEGLRVIVLEKNKQIGGALQSFGFMKQRFETAVHYIGSLAPGQTLHQLYHYLGILDQLSLKKMDESCFDRLVIAGETYRMAQGYKAFIDELCLSFPDERQNLERFIDEIKYVCEHFPLYNMRLGDGGSKMKVSYDGLRQKLDEITNNEKLKQVLTATNMLYAGDYEDTPFYLYALITNSYIESSWKFGEGSARLAKALQEVIEHAGGGVLRNQEVVRIKEENGMIHFAETKTGEQFRAKHFISGIHPQYTYAMLESQMVRPVTRRRIEATPNTISSFMVNLVLMPETIPYTNQNLYYHEREDVWYDYKNPQSEFDPSSIAAFFYEDKMNPGYASAVSLLSVMDISHMGKWASTLRTTSYPQSRGEGYQEEKELLAGRMIDKMDSVIPGLKDSIRGMDCCSPLSYRDYLNTPDGSLYGFRKNVNDQANTTYATHTKIPNLFLTGQNINMHGILGVSITAILTAAELCGLENLVNKIRAAS